MTSLEQKELLVNWFTELRDRICQAFEELEDELKHPYLLPGRFRRKAWQRADKIVGDGGGGVMSLMEGAVFEKVGVNISTVHGQFAPEFAKEMPGAAENPCFWASGISIVAHPLHPLVPAIHMNTRHIITTKSWFGGGTDLTPTFEFIEDTQDFHKALRHTCDQFDENYYPKFKLQCDDYFYLPHRQEPRGIGGIFYDNLQSNDFEKDFAFTKAVGETFLNIYPQLVRRHMYKPWTAEEKHQQLIKRSRYAEFNLIYDRGTKFGLMTQGNVDAIFMSMPPVCSWPLPSE